MKRLTWWFRIVGLIYVLLGIGFIPFINAARLHLMLPGFDAPVGGVAYRALLDYTFMFGLDLLVIGILLFYASRKPLKNMAIVWLIIALEIVRGIFHDIYMVARGYAVSIYIGFIVLHLIIIITAIVFVRQAKAEIQAGEK